MYEIYIIVTIISLGLALVLIYMVLNRCNCLGGHLPWQMVPIQV
jgi:hypothetical protein